MTTTPPEEPAEASPPPPAPAESTAATPPPAPPADQSAVFAPVPRAPRVPWVNPARRGNVIAAAVIAAVAFIGAGIGIGYAIAPSDRDHHERYRMGPGIYMVPGEYGGQGYYPMPGKLRPGKRMGNFPNGPGTPAPAVPSGSSTN
jgi:hypothetical protein